MNKGVKNILVTGEFLLRHCIFWLVTFALHRMLFIAINSGKAIDTPLSDLAMSLVQGMIFDISIVGYLSMAYCVVIAFSAPWVELSKILRGIRWFALVVSSVVVFLSPADAIMYGYWDFHYDATCIAVTTFDAIDNWAFFFYVVCGVALIIGNYVLLRFALRRVLERKTAIADTLAGKIVNVLVILVVGGVMIIPVRGGLGIAPLSISRGYFSEYQFANHAAISPTWNFLYSTQRLKGASTVYHFMDDNQAQEIFDAKMAESGNYQKIFINDRPNVVVVLLESFSAHAIEYLGGINATPTIKSLLPQSVAFSNIMAASDRSGKGLVATMCGFPVMPTISIIQYPSKSQSLPFVARKLRQHGYDDQAFVYGGDLNFNSFNSLVNLAGFNKVVTQDDFDPSQWGDKWGAHDEYALQRLFDIINEQYARNDTSKRFFDFIFTLSSHEPFTVPMERKYENDYINSVYYTDKCLGEFFTKAKNEPWWNNTVFILMADHGHPGPDGVGVTDRRRFNIPLLFTGGAMAVKDTVITKFGTQIDLAKTLLRQLDIDCEEFTFSKNMLDDSIKGHSFFDFYDGFGYADEKTYQVYDNPSQSWLRYESSAEPADSLSGMAILQVMSLDNKNR